MWQVLAHRKHLPGAFQVEQDAGPGGVVHVPVVLQKSVVEQTVVPETGRLRGGIKKINTQPYKPISNFKGVL